MHSLKSNGNHFHAWVFLYSKFPLTSKGIFIIGYLNFNVTCLVILNLLLKSLMMLPTLNLLSGVLFVHLRIFQNTFKKYPTHFKHSVSREFLEISIELILCSLSGPFSNLPSRSSSFVKVLV